MTTAQKLAVGTGSVLAVLGTAALALLAWGRRAPAAAPGSRGLTASLTVEAFHTSDPPPRHWTAAAFAESLTTRLARMPGLTVQRPGGTFSPRSEFTVRGEVSAREGRLVIAARLLHSGDSEPVWTATFWRADTLTAELVRDLAGGFAEAVYGQLARNAVTTTGERP